MVDYTIYDVYPHSIVQAKQTLMDYEKNRQFDKTCKNLFKMMNEGSYCKVVSPARSLNDKEIEEYRRYFCKKAKEDRVNYIYFTVPIIVGGLQ